ncbi:MAG: hypothetical protein WCT53_03995 [Candidatus Gracilibacteria bacterium]
MSPVIEKILEKYIYLLGEVDRKGEKVMESAPDIPCKNKCTECCKQMFPITFVEAFYLSEAIKKLDKNVRREKEKLAKKINEKILKENPLKFEKHNLDKKPALDTHAEFARFLHELQIDCPALTEDKNGACSIYYARNLDCRTMGLSFDKSQNVIVGCRRFNALTNLIPKLMPFNFMYPEKRALDAELISTTTGGFFPKNVLYLTTMCMPFLKDYSAQDWIKFFEEKGVPSKINDEKYSVVIDV